MKVIRSTTVPRSLGFFRNSVHGLKEMGAEQIVLSSPGNSLDEFAAVHGLRGIGVPMERHISPFKDLKSVWRLIRVFRKERPMMVHSMTPKAGLLCMLAAWICRVPVRVHTFTGLVFPTSTGLKRRILMVTDWLTCACATHVIPEGEGVKADLLDHHITRKPIEVLGNGNVRGIDLEKFNPSDAGVREESQKLRRTDCFTFIFVGRLVGDKGINELVDAFVRLNKEFPASRLLLVGKSEADLDPLKPATVQAIESNPAIEAVGQQKDVRPWLLASDAFVLPSYREGFPNVVIEAGAMGLPSIVTDINGSREIIIEGRNGTVIPSHDADALYDAMYRFVTDPKYLEKLSSDARDLIASRFDHRYVTQCLLDFYKQILLK